MLLLPWVGGRFTDEVTDIFTTALPVSCTSNLKGTLGNGRYRLSVTSTQTALLSERGLRRGACGPLPRPLHGA